MFTSFRFFVAGALLLAVIGSPVSAQQKAESSAERAKALRECNAKGEKLAQYTWGVTQLQVYRTCMVEHHQPE